VKGTNRFFGRREYRAARSMELGKETASVSRRRDIEVTRLLGGPGFLLAMRVPCRLRSRQFASVDKKVH